MNRYSFILKNCSSIPNKIYKNSLSSLQTNTKSLNKRFGTYSLVFLILVSITSFSTLPPYAQRPQILARNRLEKLD